MTGNQPEPSSYDSAALDAYLESAVSGIIAKLEEGFDPEAGLADIYARCGVTRPATRPDAAGDPDRTSGRQRAESARLQEVCDQIDAIRTLLDNVNRSARTAPFGGAAFLEAARPVLIQLRVGLANRTTPKSEAERLIGEVQSYLDRADAVLRSQHSSTLDDTVRERCGEAAEPAITMTGQMQALHEMIARLYADAGHDLSLAPAM